jgi:hypothetical protein
MSPVTSSRYRVSFFDGDAYDIIVEAISEAAAIKKARRIYNLNGLAYEHANATDWNAVALVQEVRS